MVVKDTITPLSKVLSLSAEGGGINKNYINIILNEEIPVLCINRSTKKKRLMPFKVLYDNKPNFWQIQGGSWEYYLTGESLDIIAEKSSVKSGNWEVTGKGKSKTNKKVDEDIEEIKPAELDGFGIEYVYFSEMTNDEKVECLNKDKNRLDALISKKFKDEVTVTEALVDTAKDAIMINHVALEEALRLNDADAKKNTQSIVDSTSEMVRSSAQLLQENVFCSELMHALVEKSKGTIVQHMSRVYLSGLAFLTYYNELVSTSSAIQKLRISFPKKFRKIYHSLLPHIHIDDINLERVFLGGMRAITPDLCFKWAVGFLVHDIGKASAVEYHEGGGTYDRQTVVDHVKYGYRSIVTKTNYPVEASLITGYHHEYYGDSAGYGYFRAYLQQYKKVNPNAKQDYCITYDLEPILDYQALAYFPAKLLEIIDVYDSLTDSNRLYREPMSPEGALLLMQQDFIKKHLKLDPILFHIFEQFIREKEEKSAKEKKDRYYFR